MGILKKVKKAVDALLEQENENYEKGVDFERYVIELFLKNKRYFAIHSWTRDISNKHQGVMVESDSDPDILIRYKPTDEKFAVECKYRSHLYNDKLCWTTREKLEDYRLFAQKNRIPTFIVIGLGGDPRNPEQMFCIPLEKAKYPELYPSVFRRFERDPRRSFFWKNGVLH
ncbi:MAG: hypothetical protein ACXQTM_03780 [Methanosarcinales archaeon]